MVPTMENIEIQSLLWYIPSGIIYILIIGILCLDIKLVFLILKSEFQCGVVRDFLLILVTVQFLLMIILGIHNIEIIRYTDTYNYILSLTTIAFIYIDLLFHTCVSLTTLYFLRHRNLTDSERRKLLHCKIKQQEEKE